MNNYKKKLKATKILIISFLLFLLLALTVFADGNRNTSDKFNQIVAQFEREYPEGSHWNGYYRQSSQCVGFAKLLVDRTFGFQEYEDWNLKYPRKDSFHANNIDLGDYVYVEGILDGIWQEHAFFVRGIDDSFIYVFECLGGSNNVIRTNHPYKRSEIEKALQNDGSNIRKAKDEYYTSVFTFMEGWEKEPNYGIWRYRLNDGSYATGWKIIDNYWYYFKSDGAMVYECWLEINGRWHHFDYDGHMEIGWKEIEGLWYHFDKDGYMDTGWKDISGKSYFFDDAGAMLEEEWVGNYYVGADGAKYRNLCATIDGIEYEFDNQGKATAEVVETTTPETTTPETSTPETTTPETDSSETLPLETNPPGNVPPETSSPNKTLQYRYRVRSREYEYKTSSDNSLAGWEYVKKIEGNSKWGSWSDWSTEIEEASENVQIEKRTVSSGVKTQIYLGRYYSESKNNFSPNKLDSSYSFDGGWFDEDTVTFKGQVFAGGRDDCYTIPGTHYYYFEIGSHGGETREVSSGNETEYRYREKENTILNQFRRLKYSKWSEWSGWSKTPVEEDDLTDVETEFVI